MVDVQKLRANAQFALCHKGPMKVPTQDVLELLDRLEAAEADRDSHERVSSARAEQRDEILEKYHALAAHVERLQERARLITDRRQWEGDSDPRVPHVLLDRLSEACMDAPATSLGRRDAEQQATAIDKWSETIIRLMEQSAAKHAADPNHPPICLQMIRELCCDMDADADRLRRQAEEGAS